MGTLQQTITIYMAIFILILDIKVEWDLKNLPKIGSWLNICNRLNYSFGKATLKINPEFLNYDKKSVLFYFKSSYILPWKWANLFRSHQPHICQKHLAICICPSIVQITVSKQIINQWTMENNIGSFGLFVDYNCCDVFRTVQWNEIQRNISCISWSSFSQENSIILFTSPKSGTIFPWSQHFDLLSWSLDLSWSFDLWSLIYLHLSIFTQRNI